MLEACLHECRKVNLIRLKCNYLRFPYGRNLGYRAPRSIVSANVPNSEFPIGTPGKPSDIVENASMEPWNERC